MRAICVFTVSSVMVVTALDRAAAQPAAAPPCAQPAACIAGKWKDLHARAVQQLETNDSEMRATVRQEREGATRQASIVAAVDAVEPDDSTGAATVRRLAGAIKTNPEGTEAGLVVAPFALGGSKVLPGLEVTFAALKEDMTRLGTSYTWQSSTKLGDVWSNPAACPLPPRVAKLEKPKDLYVSACTSVVARLPDTVATLSTEDRATYEKRIRRAQLACGLVDPGPGESRVERLADAITQVRHAVEVTNEMAPRASGSIPQDTVVQALALAGRAEELVNWGPELWTSCYSDEDIRGHIRRLYWNNRTWKFALGTSFDFFPRKWGFNPAASEPPKDSDADLPNGDVKQGEARMDFSTAKAGTEFSFGSGFGRGRDKLDDELRGYIPLSFSCAHAVSLLPTRPLRTTGGELNVVDGESPPRLVFGLITAFQIAVNKRESQTTRWNAVKIQPHVDFLINEKLGFRLGVPFNGEIVVRDKKDEVAETATTPGQPAVPEKRALQWTVPVAIVAVIKL